MKYACMLVFLLISQSAHSMEQEENAQPIEPQKSFAQLEQEWRTVNQEISGVIAAIQRLDVHSVDMHNIQAKVSSQHEKLHPLTYQKTSPRSIERLELCQSDPHHDEIVQQLDQELREVHLNIAHEIINVPSQQKHLTNKLKKLTEKKEMITSQIEQYKKAETGSSSSTWAYLQQFIPTQTKIFLPLLGNQH